MAEWIPISERLPNIKNYTKPYLVTLTNGSIAIAIFTECNGEHWWNYGDEYVIAWMELPKPYCDAEIGGKNED